MTNSIKLEVIDRCIARVILEDRESNNTFTPRFVQGLQEVFTEINKNNYIKVVVVHGYGNYFCCGGSRLELLKISSGEITFDQLNFYRLLLDCKVPVISAMQGHAIGGGLVFGSYADIILLAKESIYSTNFMKYGFTPGMGATFIIPHRFGNSLGSEMLYTASNYYGNTLSKRGVPFTVLEKNSVIDAALHMAEGLAEKSTVALTLLKSKLSASIVTDLPSYVQQELDMHDTCFVHTDIEHNIKRLYEN
ncbi:polyketide synthase [Pseudomonadota bacterium]